MVFLSEIFLWFTALTQCRSSKKLSLKSRAMVSSIRCEQGTKSPDGLDVWLSRGAMLGFTAAITFELATGKGVLENFGLTAPLPTIALVLTALVGAGAAFFIFQSASSE
ncbi:stress enhanced protein 1 [Carex littledalei]|uniref:Stress enhanced protein 1 n=1 Tax=Carex littledalei TaxID=544730 RepID=A0A833VKG5_9POAL|nr:stress enhanced protein 1 [Carex littledalei]